MNLLDDQQNLTVQLQGVERVWAVRRRLIIPRDSIVSITWNDEFKSDERLLRLRGTGLRGVLAAGTFVGKKERVFLYIRGARGLARKSSNVLAITTKNFPFLKVLLSSDKETADKLIRWLGNT